MTILTNTGGIVMTNCFVVADEKTKQAVMFDAPDHTTEPLLNEVVRRGWDLVGLWLTHGHFDHFADHAVVKQKFPQARILIHKLEELKVQNPDLQTRLFGLPLRIPPLKADGFVVDQEKLKIGSLEVVVLHTPGHSAGSVVYHFPKEQLLVGGDLIIGGSVGRTDLPDSNQRDMISSLRRVMALPGATKLLGGHGPETTLEQERQTNYFLQDVLEAP